ncbi:hypothetical protein BP00DRAFT_262256 [Aspergillus indologenus CBS 114.80]|uniref:Uncharacterized protein n=1 Tax=Aspergillus indologenus CBS 114.80 TaxID=1450541 RepID=A0A2V5I2B1_9EURO|nr:hypothetical protein BP00DRAFT_262256 [Aspergillus indologenus CBS 114.80]
MARMQCIPVVVLYNTYTPYLLTLVVVVVVVGKQGRFETAPHYGVHALSFHRFIHLGGVTPSIQMSGMVSSVDREKGNRSKESSAGSATTGTLP